MKQFILLITYICFLTSCANSSLKPDTYDRDSSQRISNVLYGEVVSLKRVSIFSDNPIKGVINNNKIFLTDSLVKSLINVGVINFSKSNTKKDSCRTYFIDLDLENNFYLEIANCPKTIKIIDFKLH